VLAGLGSVIVAALTGCAALSVDQTARNRTDPAVEVLDPPSILLDGALTGLAAPQALTEASTAEDSGGPLAERANAVWAHQATALPALADLHPGARFEPRIISRLFPRLSGLSAAVVLAVMALGCAAVAISSDRGSREAIRILATQPTPTPNWGRLRLVDHTVAVSRQCWRGAAGWACRVTLLAGLFGLIYATGFRRWITLLAMTAAFLAANLMKTARSKRSPQLRPWPVKARIVELVGAAITWSVISMGLVWIADAVVIVVLIGAWNAAAVWATAGFALLALSTLGSFAHLRASRAVQAAIRADRRPPVLLLRSFQDAVPDIRTAQPTDGLADDLSDLGYARFEQTVAADLTRLGPVIGVGRPPTAPESPLAWRIRSERLRAAGATVDAQRGQPDLAQMQELASVFPPLSAVATYLSDAVWQTQRAERSQRSRLVAIIAGSWSTLAFEVQQLGATGDLAKTVFVFPPTDRQDLGRQVRATWSALNLAPEAFPPELTAYPLALHLTASGLPCLHLSRARPAEAYAIVLDQIAAEVATQAATPWRAPLPARTGAPQFPPDHDSAKRVKTDRGFVGACWSIAARF
jgi:hypothetical protein